MNDVGISVKIRERHNHLGYTPLRLVKTFIPQQLVIPSAGLRREESPVFAGPERRLLLVASSL